MDLPYGEALPASWEAAWQEQEPYSILLESGKTGRYTYLGRQPAAVLRAKGSEAQVWTRAAAGGYEPSQTIAANPLEAVRRWLEGRRAPRIADGPKFAGGIAGYWSYDVARSIERLPELATDDLELPEALFLQLDELWIHDREQSCIYAAVQASLAAEADERSEAVGAAFLRSAYDAAAARALELLEQWTAWASSPSALERTGSRKELLERTETGGALPFPDVPADAGSPFPQERYKDAVRAIQRYIAAGDVFQVNLSLRQQKRTQASPEELYEWLRLINPSPYMGLLRTPEFQLVSASPELLVELADGKLYTRPIAGTRRRGRTPEEDAELELELRTNEKETAEHIMLVDLERNDLGRVSRYGTVRVEELMVVERYSHVMHLVSQVNGELVPGLDAFDVISAVFPGGTITGAPKIRTMEIIEELEPVRRGPYTGSMGWIDYSGDMEFNIIIRTMAVKDRVAHIQAGAGIVIDSDPEREYRESISKAKALWRAFHYAALHGPAPIDRGMEA
ncbi:anthranilate synthase component I family protein [Paenibacillus albicereus]|uniref:Anthranilate synthase component I family protein n=2 Tax=Paenibacillus albicereus TaxID=2726185 RepID=A0A6H2H383_9BACL|nr:anthranilate synthase component I family protein [Paenibacillus albicereus]